MTHDEKARARILILEDEPHLREAMVGYLNLDGFSATGVATLAEATAWISINPFDILVLDLGLPDGDGLAWLNARSDLADKGIIIASARGELVQRLVGVQAGADIYLVKPVQLEELSSLAINLYRRLRPVAAQPWKLYSLQWALESPDGQSMKLTNSELRMLMLAAAVCGQAVTRNKIILGLGHSPDTYDPKRLEIMIRRLRGKSRDSLRQTLPLETVHGIGVVFAAPIVIV